MTADSIFIDANIAIYLAQPDSPFHAVAKKVVGTVEDGGGLVMISNQVIREYYTTLTRTRPDGAIPDRHAVLRNIARMERRWSILSDNADVRYHLLDLAATIPIGGRQIHDANIVATMLAYGVGGLLTNNPADFKRFAHLIVIRPLVEGGLA